MRIKCDEAMKRSKTRCRIEAGSWQCRGDCARCICGMRELSDGTWEHIRINNKGEMARMHGRGEAYD